MRKINKYCKNCHYRGRAGLTYENVCKSDIMIVSDYPSERDLKANSIFSGKDKLVIDKALKLNELNKSKICFANSCRCALDKTKDSTKEQNSSILFCREYLKLAIEVVQPRVIVTLGAIALKQILKKPTIMKHRGMFFESEEFNCNVFVTVHPSYCLINSQTEYPNINIENMSARERLIFKDFQLLKAFIDNDYKPPEIKTENYIQVDDISLTDAKYYAIDCEASGLDLFNKGTKVLCWGISNKESKSEVIII